MTDTLRSYASRIKNKLANTTVVDRRELYKLHEESHLSKVFAAMQVDCVFDVGANRGQYATMLREKVGYRGRIISFEPIPVAAREARARARGDALWTIEEAALGPTDGSVVFNRMAGDQFSSLGSPDHEQLEVFAQKNVVVEQLTVTQKSLETAFREAQAKYQFSRPFLKMDSQGFDVAIFESGRSIIREFVGLQSELSIRKIYKEAVDYKDAIDVYRSGGFELSALVPNNYGHFPRLVEIDCIMLRGDLIDSPQPHETKPLW